MDSSSRIRIQAMVLGGLVLFAVTYYVFVYSADDAPPPKPPTQPVDKPVAKATPATADPARPDHRRSLVALLTGKLRGDEKVARCDYDEAEREALRFGLPELGWRELNPERGDLLAIVPKQTGSGYVASSDSGSVLAIEWDATKEKGPGTCSIKAVPVARIDLVVTELPEGARVTAHGCDSEIGGWPLVGAGEVLHLVTSTVGACEVRPVVYAEGKRFAGEPIVSEPELSTVATVKAAAPSEGGEDLTPEQSTELETLEKERAARAARRKAREAARGNEEARGRSLAPTPTPPQPQPGGGSP